MFILTAISILCQIAFAMFGVYVLIDDKNVLDAQKIFVSMALINILKTPLSQLPFAMSTTMQVRIFCPDYLMIFTDLELNTIQIILVLQALVSLKRLGKFLCQDELKPENVTRESFQSGETSLIDKHYCAIDE